MLSCVEIKNFKQSNDDKVIYALMGLDITKLI